MNHHNKQSLIRMKTDYFQFSNRTAAGQQLAESLLLYVDRPDVLVLGLPRGGLPVAYEVARVLHAPLDICLVRKLGVLGQSEVAMGAIASGGVRVLNDDVITKLQISQQDIEKVAVREFKELQRRDRVYRRDRPPLDIADRTVILVDDGMATGSSMRSAIAALKPQHPAVLIVAIPVASQQACNILKTEVDEVVCLMTPKPFHSLSLWYKDFPQTTDKEVCELLAQLDGDNQHICEIASRSKERKQYKS
jgi:putative phosphoribosyl transferase